MQKKMIYILLVISLLFTVVGVSLAFFSLKVLGNDTAKNNKVTTGSLELTFNDTNEIILDNAFPGDLVTKTFTVKNTGNNEINYNLIWQKLTNEIIKNELTIEGECKSLNSNNMEEGTCESIPNKSVAEGKIISNIPIQPGHTHEYSIKITFIDTGESQNYNKNKLFSGVLGIEEYKKPTSISFKEDSWETIQALVQIGEISNYNVGDTKEISLDDYGTHTIRIANASTPSECSTEGFSQTACGLVLEFADIITTHNMNVTNTSLGGWPATSMRAFINNDIYNSLPPDLKNVIIDTTVVSSHGKKDVENFISSDKLYLLSTKEIYTNWSSTNESSKDLTRTLDYYTNLGVTTSKYSGAIKKNGTSATYWWTRSAVANMAYIFYRMSNTGSYSNSNAVGVYGVSPAFRIG